MKQFFGKKSRSALALVLMVSLGLHIIAFIIFGAIKLAGEVLREDTVFKPAMIDTPPEEEPIVHDNIKELTDATPPPSPPKVVVNDASELSIPGLDINLVVDTTSVISRSSGNISSFDDIRKQANVAKIFDMDVEARRLGVLLDVSFSTHGVINSVIEEIQRGFPDALVAFAPGCAIDDRKNELVSLRDYEETAPNYEGGRYTTKNFIDSLLKREGFEEIWKRAHRRNNGVVVFSEIQGNQGLSGCDVAMQYLADNDADVIYWFADFNDHLDPELSEKIAAYLRRRGTKLIIHDFVPGLPGGKRLEVLQMMADRTRGEFFLKEFKK